MILERGNVTVTKRFYVVNVNLAKCCYRLNTLADCFLALDIIQNTMTKGRKLNSSSEFRLLLSEPIRVKWLYAFLAVVSFLLYANTLKHDFAYDDYSVIKNNSLVIKGVAALPELIHTPYRWGYYITSNDTYRPLSLMMFAVEYQIFDGEPSGSHLINVLLFITAVLLLFTLLRKVFIEYDVMVLFCVCLLFAVHPIHTEVVANIKSRDELLCFCCSFYCLIMLNAYVGTGSVKKLFGGTLMFFLSLLSKETSIVFLVIGPLILFANNAVDKRFLKVAGSLLATAIIYISIRLTVLEAYNVHHASDIDFIDNFLVGVPFDKGLATTFVILGKYLALLFVPYPLVCDYTFNGIPLSDFRDWKSWISFLVYVVLIVVMVFRLIKDKRDIIGIGLAFFIIPLTLFSNVLFFIGAPMAERFLFFSSVGFCIVIVACLNKIIAYRKAFENDLKLNRKMLLSILAPAVVLFFVITVNRNTDWKDNLTLFSTDVKKMPDNARLNFFVGNELVMNAREQNQYGSIQVLDSGVQYLHKALSIYPEYKDVKLALGNSFFLRKVYDSAEFYYLNVLKTVKDIDALHNLDVLYFNTNRYNESISVCKEILEVRPERLSAYRNIGVCYIKLSYYDSAISILKKGIAVFPDSASLYQTTAIAYGLSNNNDSALKYELLARSMSN